MKRISWWLVIFALIQFQLIAAGAASEKDEIVVLDGNSLQLEDLQRIADGAKVDITKKARKRVEAAFQVLISAAQEGLAIYGFTSGVGLNKDRNYVQPDGELSPELIEASIKFNRALIRAHVGSVGPRLDDRLVRAVLAIRLNMALSGSPGLQPAYLDVFIKMLNSNLLPIIPMKGSIGQADITVLAHLALAMIGEGKVNYQGQQTAAATAFAQAEIPLPDPYAKDGLALLSTSAYSLALALEPLSQLQHLVSLQRRVFVMSLEALNGNVIPLLADNVKVKGLPYGISNAAKVVELLEGSYLWQEDTARPLQDPLSYRDAHWIFSTMDEAFHRALTKFNLQINHGDDNPTIALGAEPARSSSKMVQKYYFKGGAVFSSSNFEPLPWALDFEYATIAVTHNANAAAMRISKLNDPRFTGLSRFLGNEQSYHALGAMEKVPTALASENHVLANPASVSTNAIAGTVEDVASNAPLIMTRLNKVLENYQYILAIELIHAIQALKLRLIANPELELSESTRELFKFSESLAEFNNDHPYSDDFEAANKYLQSLAAN